MYIPIWLIIIAIILFLVWNNSKSKQKNEPDLEDDVEADITDVEDKIIERASDSLEKLEGLARYYKTNLLELALSDSPTIIDFQDKFVVMEANYFRVKQRYLSDDSKKLELARDWAVYVEALNDLYCAWEMFDMSMGENPWDDWEESSKEPSVIVDEVEKKFKGLLGKDFQKLLPNFGDRRKKAGLENTLPNREKDWMLYQDSPSYHKMVELRAKEKESKEAKAK